MRAVVARLSRIICKPEIADPMGGFFATAEGFRGGSTAPFRTGIQYFSGYRGVIAAAATSQ
jgi:hypothetical protein